jgi:glycosyltransferase involved in cell wall biosynthesis
MEKPLRIWLVTTGEPLPIDGPHARLFRTGLLAEQLTQLGHAVTWWSAAFNHSMKKHRTTTDASYVTAAGYHLELIWSPGYNRAISFKRLIDHRFMGIAFMRRLRNVKERPDVIVCSWPLIELCKVSVEVAEQWRIPVILDVRDLWPDIFVDLAPKFMRTVARFALRPMYRQARSTFRRATAITGINDDFVRWGVQYGSGRPESARSFPLGYPRIVSDAADFAAAEEFWRDLGVSQTSGKFIICFFGVFGRTLDLDTVLNATNALAEESVQFVLCGIGEYHSKMQQQTKGLKNVILPGWIDANKIRALMRVANVGLAPYRNTSDFQASIPNKAVEYMAGGLPVLTCLQGQLSALIAKCESGECYLEGDYQSLVDAIHRLRSDAARLATMAKNASMLFELQFEASRVYQDYANLIEDIAQRPDVRPNA